MADTVNSLTVFNGARRLVIKLTSQSDGTGESDVIKVDKSAFVGLNGLEPSYFIVEKIQYSSSGMIVAMRFNRTSPVVFARLQGDGYMDFTKVGGVKDAGTGSTGDIEFTTVGHTSGDSYDITLHLLKHD